MEALFKMPARTRTSPCAVEPASLTNVQEPQNVLFDTLHHKAHQAGAVCSNSVCQGSILQPKSDTSSQFDEKVNFADVQDFYDQYYSSRSISEEEQTKRLDEVIASIKSTNQYDMTKDELEFGVTTAWRNAPRCIGRIQWSKLKLFDGRLIQSTREMFELICEHIEYATNYGNIRSAIAVFPSRQSGIECRIWNGEYISYAGFEVSLE
ncbi:NOS2 [Bugula neritina]|uniref:nitric-oxide synthase (NADPH) n=1 Tax=Bugula neritina TaxID=10212 RepID=A0A7J7IYC1_BUGNE|nr:NOS2 [Bugula neritina]